MTGSSLAIADAGITAAVILTGKLSMASAMHIVALTGATRRSPLLKNSFGGEKASGLRLPGCTSRRGAICMQSHLKSATLTAAADHA